MSEEIVFNDWEYNGVKIYAITAFTDYSIWYRDIVNRVLPKLGEKYMKKFLSMDCDIVAFLNALKYGDIK